MRAAVLCRAACRFAQLRLDLIDGGALVAADGTRELRRRRVERKDERPPADLYA